MQRVVAGITGYQVGSRGESIVDQAWHSKRGHRNSWKAQSNPPNRTQQEKQQCEIDSEASVLALIVRSSSRLLEVGKWVQMIHMRGIGKMSRTFQNWDRDDSGMNRSEESKRKATCRSRTTVSPNVTNFFATTVAIVCSNCGRRTQSIR